MKKMVTCLSLMAMAAFGQIIGPNLVKNAGFEDVDDNGGATFWKGNTAVYKVVDGGRNGGKQRRQMHEFHEQRPEELPDVHHSRRLRTGHDV